MTIYEKVDQRLRALGLMPKHVEDGATDFTYKDHSIRSCASTDDAPYLCLRMLCYVNVTDDNREAALEAAAKVNSSAKFVKVVVNDDEVVVALELLFTDDADFDTVIIRMLEAMLSAFGRFYDYML